MFEIQTSDENVFKGFAPEKFMPKAYGKPRIAVFSAHFR